MSVAGAAGADIYAHETEAPSGGGPVPGPSRMLDGRRGVGAWPEDDTMTLLQWIGLGIGIGALYALIRVLLGRKDPP